MTADARSPTCICQWFHSRHFLILGEKLTQLIKKVLHSKHHWSSCKLDMGLHGQFIKALINYMLGNVRFRILRNPTQMLLVHNFLLNRSVWFSLWFLYEFAGLPLHLFPKNDWCNIIPSRSFHISVSCRTLHVRHFVHFVTCKHHRIFEPI